MKFWLWMKCWQSVMFRFQQKCLDKMHEIRNQGRTILFVSHSMAAVTRLCERAILLDKGRMVVDGLAQEVVNEYMADSWQLTAEREWQGCSEAPGNEFVRLCKVRVRNEKGDTIESSDIRYPIGIEVTYEVVQHGHVLVPKIDLYNEGGALIFAAHDVESKWRHQSRPPGRYVSTAWIPGNFLSEGNLQVQVQLVSHTPATAIHAHVPKAVAFQVADSLAKDSARGDFTGPVPGIIRPILKWTTNGDQEEVSREVSGRSQLRGMNSREAC